MQRMTVSGGQITLGRTAKAVEIGLPYSDPILDGPVIQRAGTTALRRGVRTRDVFAAVEAVASTGTQAVCMTYWSLVDRYGVDAFARDFANAGGAGLIADDGRFGAWQSIGHHASHMIAHGTIDGLEQGRASDADAQDWCLNTNGFFLDRLPAFN